MDLKFKSMAWVENMYQKFEAACQDVDDFVNQDTVRFVETKVQTVGKSMKKFYSGLVQDIHPPLGNPVKDEGQAAAPKQVASTESTVEINELPVDTEAGKSSVEPYLIGLTRELQSNAPSFSRLHSVNELILAPSTDHIEELDFDLSAGQSENVSDDENLTSADEHLIWEKPSQAVVPEVYCPKNEDSCEALLTSESSNACNVPVKDSSAACEDKTMETRKCYNLVNETDCNSDVSSSFPSSKCIATCENRTMETEKGFNLINETNCSSDVSSCSEDVATCRNRTMETRKCYNLVNETDCCTDVSNIFPSSEHIATCENKPIGTEKFYNLINETDCSSVVSSSIHSSEYVATCGNRTRKCYTLENETNSCSSSFPSSEYIATCDNKTMETKKFYNLINETDCSSDVSSGIRSSEYVPTCGNRMEIGLMSSSSNSSCMSGSSDTHCLQVIERFRDNSIGNDESGCNCNIFRQPQFSELMLNISRGNQLTEIRLPSSGNLMSNGKTDDLSDITDSSMESIELSDKLKLEDSCVVVDSQVPYALSCRAPMLRSYKKKIREVFASRRRLIKEYEQLAILYKDVDLGFSQHAVQSKTLSTSSELMHDSCDCGWELL